MRAWAAAVAATVVVALLVGSYFLVAPSSTGRSSSVSSTSSGTIVSTTGSSDGLELRLGISAADIPSGANLTVTVSEYNTRSSVNNVTKADLWPMQGLSVGSCEGEANSVLPFGIAVFQGAYTATSNLSGAAPLEIFPVVPCPMIIRLVTGYLFQPLNDTAVVLPSGGSPTPMTASVTFRGVYSGASLKSLAPGAYTVVAGDEWGALETLQFTVTP